MDKLTGIISDVLLFAEYFSFFYVVLCRDFRKRTRKISGYIITCILIWIVGVFLDFGWDGASLLPVSINEMIMFLLLYLVFDIIMIQFIPIAVCEYLLSSIMGLSLLIPLKRLNINDDVITIICHLIVLIIIWVYYFCACRNKGDNTIKLPAKMWWTVDGIMCVLTLMMMFFSYVIVEMLPYNKAMIFGRFMSVLGSVFICVLLFVLMYYYNSSQDFRVQKELVEIQNEQQRIYFKGLLEKEEETRRFRHDIINDLLEIKNYSEKKDYLKLDNYLQDVLGEIIDISDSYYDVGNDIVNTVLNYYLKPLKNNYEIEVDGYMGNPVSIEERDICVVCANLIKNSAEAVQKVKQGSIIFSVNQGKQFISIMVRNTYDGKLTKDKNGEIITQKKDKKNHGVGINAVKRVVKKYEGKYETNIDEKMYCVKIFLKLK